MTAVAYTTMFSEVLPYVPGCPVDMLTNAIREAAIEFCDQSLIWQFDVAPITTLANVGSYALATPADTTVSKVVKAWYNNLQITPKDVDSISLIYNDWTTESGTPVYYLQLPPDLLNLIVVPFPTATDVVTNGLKVKVALKPSRASTTIDSGIAETYTCDIGYGAKARLMMAPGKPYYNNKLSAYNDAAFRAGVSRARIRADRGMMRDMQRVSFPKL